MTRKREVERVVQGQIDALDAATRSAVFSAGDRYRNKVNRQIKSRFRGRRAGKATTYRIKDRLDPAAIVRVSPKYLSVFAAPDRADREIEPAESEFLAIPIPPLTRQSNLTALTRKLKSEKRLRIKPTKRGFLYLDMDTPIFVLVRRVEEPKRLDLEGLAEAEGERIPDDIDTFLDKVLR